MRFALTLVLLSAFLSTRGQVATSFDYRKVRWGMTLEQVLKLEGGFLPPDKPNTLDVGTINVNGRSASLSYGFEKKRLIAAAVVFSDTYTNNNRYISEHKSVDKALTSKYGKATNTKLSYLKKPTISLDPGYELDMGNAQYLTQWKNDRTVIKHILHAPKGTIYHYIQYFSATYLKEMDAKKMDNL